MNWSFDLHYRNPNFALTAALSGGNETIAIIGPNGAGKSTLLRLLAGAMRPSSGRWVCGPVTLFDSDQGLCVPPEQRNIGYVPQGYTLFPHLSVIDNIGFGWIPHGIPRDERHQRARLWMEQLEIASLQDRAVHTLSGGEQQSVALARALAIEPQLLLLDEPLAALDAVTRRSLRTWLQTHLEQRAAPTIFVTHNAQDVHRLADTVVVLEAGQILQMGPPKTVAMSPQTQFAEAFFE